MSETTPYVTIYVQMRPLDGPPAVVRTDPAPDFKALTDDQQLKHHRITIESKQESCGRESGSRARKRVTPKCPLRRPCVPSQTSSSESQSQRAHPIMWLFLQRDVDTAGSILKPSNTTARPKHHRSVEGTANRSHSEKAEAAISRRRPANHRR